MPYVVDPTNPAAPTDADPAEQGQAELRALKGYLQGLLPVSLSSMNFLRRNKVINGNMRFDQRNEGAAVALAGAGVATYVVDKFVGYKIAAATVTGQQASVTLANGSTNSCNIITTVGAPSGAAEIAGLTTPLEGYDIAELQWGTANAVAISVSFVVSAPVTGTYALAIRNATKTRSYIAPFAVNIANTAQVITINNIPGCTDGVWNHVNNLGIELFFDLGSGTNFEAVAASAWQAGNFTRVAGYAKPQNAAGTFKLTNLQFERGAAASLFEILPQSLQQSLVERYYEKTYNIGTTPGTVITTDGAVMTLQVAATNPVLMWRYRSVKRTVPTITTYNTTTGASAQMRNSNGNDCTATAPIVGFTSDQETIISATAAAGAASGQYNTLHLTAECDLL